MLDVLRRRVLPLAMWCVVMGTAAWLWRGIDGGAARGYVEGIAYDVTSLEPGRIASVAVVPGQRVRAGQVIALLDSRAIDAELDALAAERVRVEAELQAAASQTRLVVGETTRGIEESVDSAQRALQQARADKSVSSAELVALEKQIDAVRELVDKRMADRRELAELTVEQAALRKQVQVADGLIRQLEAQATSARARRGGLPAELTEKTTLPLRAELDILASREELLELRKDSLSLRAPGSGEVSSVLLWPGELANPGSVVATITGPAASEPGGAPLVFVCASEAESADVVVGERVTLTAPTGGASLSGHVRRLGAAVELLPERCWRDPRLPLWGRGIYVAVDDAVTLLPGQTFAVGFSGEPGAVGIIEHATHAPIAAALETEPSTNAGPVAVDRDRAPIELEVPASVRARSRFEPSAIVWSEARDRYLVVSDDTGLGKADEHAPLLFTMNAQGVIDDVPIVVTGIDALTDLESIAIASDGGVYLLASNSFSRKGKRSAARQFFGHVALSSTEARVTASVELASLLDAAPAAVREALGVPSTSSLDIEGMTATHDGGLLLGLKSPVNEEGAPIWHLADPAKLLETGELASGALALWGRVPLSVSADGREVQAGVAELLELPDASVLVAATATGDEPSVQDGAVFRISGKTSVASPSIVWTFPGLKGEGLARTPNGDAIAIVFDTGDAAPRWTERRWPAP